MPNRTTLNKYELFIGKVRKIAKKKDLLKEEQYIKDMAMLIAAISSSHSWKSYKYLRNGNEFDKDAIAEELQHAFSHGWRDISEADIEEILTSHIDDHIFSMWSYNIMDKDQRPKFRGLLKDMQAEFVDGIEPIELKEY